MFPHGRGAYARRAHTRWVREIRRVNTLHSHLSSVSHHHSKGNDSLSTTHTPPPRAPTLSQGKSGRRHTRTRPADSKGAEKKKGRAGERTHRDAAKRTHHPHLPLPLNSTEDGSRASQSPPFTTASWRTPGSPASTGRPPWRPAPSPRTPGGRNCRRVP